MRVVWTIRTPLRYRLHWPLCAGLILASAATGRLVSINTISQGVQWYWCAGLGIVIMSMMLIDSVHGDLSPKGYSRLPRVRQGFLRC